jgi:hypothetical protein
LGTVIAEENRALGGFNSTPTSVQILNRRVWSSASWSNCWWC